MFALLKRLWREDDAQGLIEYGLVISLMAVAIIVVLTTLSGDLNLTLQKVADKLTAANGVSN